MENKPAEERLPSDVLDALNTFLRAVPVDRLSKNLRNLFLSHIYHELDAPSVDLEESILDLQSLFDFLDAIEQMSCGSSLKRKI